MVAEESASVISPDILQLVSITFGWSLGFGFLTSVKASRQTLAIWRRTKDWKNLYVWLVWVELLSNWAMAIEFYLVINGSIPNNIGFCFTIVTFWAIEVQCLAQIILNRISLISVNRRRVFKLKILVAVLILLINISVYCIWIPARLGVSERYIQINHVWDRIEKVLYMLIDLSLNIYFLWLTRKKLIANGLTKYKRLFRFNASIVWVSICMDILVIGMMSLPNTYVYGQFHPVAYLVKLNIEMTMADLITKIVRNSPRDMNRPPIDLAPASNSNGSSAYAKYIRSWTSSTSSSSSDGKSKLGNSIDIGDASAIVNGEMVQRPPGREEADLENQEGIVKDVETIVISTTRPPPPLEHVRSSNGVANRF